MSLSLISSNSKVFIHGSQKSVPCLVCCESVKDNNYSFIQNSAHILSDLFGLFWRFMKVGPIQTQPASASSFTSQLSKSQNESQSPSIFDFTKELFPFCNACKSKLVHLFKLNEQLESIHKQINVVISCLVGKLIESDDRGRDVTLNSSRSNDDGESDRKMHEKGQSVTEIEKTTKKILDLRKRIRSKYQVAVLVNKYKEKSKIDSKPKVETSKTSVTEACKIEDSQGQSQQDHCNSGTNLIHQDVSCGTYSESPVLQVVEPCMIPITFFEEEVIEIDVVTTDTSDNLTMTMANITDGDIKNISHEATNREDKDEKQMEMEPEDDSYSGFAREIPFDEEIDDEKDHDAEQVIVRKRKSDPFVVEESLNLFVCAGKFYFEKKDKNVFACKTCSASHDTQKKCIDHIKRKHLHPTRFICDQCGKFFFSKACLQNHLKTKSHKMLLADSKDGPYKCSKCGRSFNSSSSHHFHKTRHNCNNDYQFECDEPNCGKKIFSLALLEEHKKIHSRAYKCTVCSKSFGYERGLKHHIKIHTGTQQHACQELNCDSKFRRLYQLEEHLVAVHGRISDESIVDKTSSTFQSETPSEFICEICGKSFSKHMNLRNHQKIHRDRDRSSVKEKLVESDIPLPYSCPNPACGKSFKAPSYLYFHKTHHNCNNDYEYECDEPNCGKKIYSLALLQEHKLIHSRPYQCPLCPKSFGYEKGFKHHLKIHNGSQSHFCPEEDCKSKFRRRYQLEDHMNAVHQKSLPKRKIVHQLSLCPICGKEARNIKNHISFAHTKRKGTRDSMQSEEYKHVGFEIYLSNSN